MKYLMLGEGRNLFAFRGIKITRDVPVEVTQAVFNSDLIQKRLNAGHIRSISKDTFDNMIADYRSAIKESLKTNKKELSADEIADSLVEKTGAKVLGDPSTSMTKDVLRDKFVSKLPGISEEKVDMVMEWKKADIIEFITDYDEEADSEVDED